jgi:hypothetical protein
MENNCQNLRGGPKPEFLHDVIYGHSLGCEGVKNKLRLAPRGEEEGVKKSYNSA